MYNLFVAKLTPQEGQQILDILEYKGLLDRSLWFQKQPSLGKEAAQPYLIDFLEEFWDWERSPYIQERLLYKHGIHRKYVSRCAGAIRRYWEPWFGRTVPLSTVTRQDLQDFILSFLSSKSLKSACGRNDAIKSGTVALRWAFARGLIAQDVTSGLTYYSGPSPEILILTPQLAWSLFSRPWRHYKSMMANKLAMLTGLRSGEIQALRGGDIGTDCILVRHSWNLLDGLKVPKNGCQREVYLPFADFLQELRDMAGGKENFVFHHRDLDRPMDAKCWLRELRRELALLGAEDSVVQKIRFHSWRHYYTTHLHSSGQLEPHLLQRLTGHKSAAMLRHYSGHGLAEDAAVMKAAVFRVFGEMMSGWQEASGGTAGRE